MGGFAPPILARSGGSPWEFDHPDARPPVPRAVRQCHALNLGVPGDSTQSLLWRLRSANWPEALRPDLAVLLIGTNNLGTGVLAGDIALGVQQNLLQVQRMAPQARILLVAIPSRGLNSNDPERMSVPCHK